MLQVLARPIAFRPLAAADQPGSHRIKNGDHHVTFPDVETQAPSAVNQTRLKRQLADQAIAQATAAQWSEAAETNQRLLELGPDAESENRLAKALWELRELGQAREDYQTALALDPTNRISQRIIIREICQDPRNYGKVSFPTAAKSADLRPYTKGTLIREEMDLEDDLEDDEEDEEIEDLDRVLPPESTTDEAFEEELDEADEN